MRKLASVLLTTLLAGLLAQFYVDRAARHARAVNVSKARGDQSGYLFDAERVYENWHGHVPANIIGERNRMPLYAGFLALFYRPDMSDDEFFARGRVLNIYLSVALLAAVWLAASTRLPPHTAVNLTGVAAFGWFIFKAGYTQSELLFYTLFFLAFIACTELFEASREPRLMVTAPLAGALCGLAHLTKASLLPFAGIVLLVGCGWMIAPLFRRFGQRPPGQERHGPRPAFVRRGLALALFVAVFLLVLWPYISTNKRVFGAYFYNVNSTFYVWYDNWPLASVGTALHHDGEHWPDMPAADLPGPGRYWREHSAAQIGARISAGFADMGVVLRRDFDVLPYLVLFVAAAVSLAAARPGAAAALVGAHAWPAVLVAMYGAVYLAATAFYHPISGTGTGRFLLLHGLPFFFTLARFTASRRFADLSWHARWFTLRVRHFDWLVSAVILFNVLTRVGPRLMTTYGGF
ncbi:MAG TPA: hypothetical protein VM032_12250 [Vicinamibacterales bacterium]|nr:hypothetical protein [Vicinamibacterales bacterium]